MAYNYGFPATYQSPYQQQPQSYYGYPQPAQMPNAQIPQVNLQTSTGPIQSGILWVANEQEAQAYPVAPNNAVALWDSTNPAVYIKQADASGKPVLKTYDLVERPQEAVSATERRGDVGSLRKELQGEIKALWAAVEEIRSSDSNGKREHRKKEVQDDDAE